MGPSSGGPVQIQAKMQRQRQLALERQRAASARQLIGVGVVAQSNPLATANTNMMKQAQHWQFPETPPSGLSKEKLSGGAGGAGPPSSGASKKLGSQPTTGAARNPMGMDTSEARSKELGSRGAPGTAHSQELQSKTSGRQHSRSAGGEKNQLDEMLENLDVEELVDQLTGKEPRASVTSTKQEEAPVNDSRLVPSGTGRRQRSAGQRPGADSPSPKGGAWGVDARLVVQGPPPKVVAVEGFDDPVPEFTTAKRQSAGRRRPQKPQNGVEEFEQTDDARSMGFDRQADHEVNDTVLREFSASEDRGRKQELDANVQPSAQDSKSGKKRWWNRFAGGSSPSRSPSPGHDPEAEPARGKSRAPQSAVTEVTEVTQISTFDSEDM